MNLSLLEYLAAHEQLSESDSQHAEFLVPGRPTVPSGYPEWEATWRAKLRFIRARALVEEAGKLQKEQALDAPGTFPSWDKQWSLMPGNKPDTVPESSSETLLMCPVCRGVDFNIGKQETLKCTSWHATGRNGCGWRGELRPTKTTGLSFSEALVAMKEGKGIKRPSYTGTLYLGETFGVGPEDILAEDWMVVS